ncbi:MAG: hypothetical protein KKB20_21925 [Proteobacteria bacterium]|nr:hypothetical protein [Pseudomonadota bacterium]
MKTALKIRVRVLLRILTLFVIMGLALAPGLDAADYNDPVYRAAVADAQIARPAEISRELWAITAYNPDMIWQGTPGASKVLVLTWTGPWYDGFEGRNYQLTFGPVWVTPAGQLKAWFEARHRQPSVERIEQLLGLPTDSGKTRFVQMWVDPADLFRPSPDPEITDSEAELDYPVGAGSSVDATYRTWFDALKITQYLDPTPYPWTRLGYTYDWGADDHVGLSEFVISVNIRSASDHPWVVVAKVYTNEEFFQTFSPGNPGSGGSAASSGCFIQALH